MKNYVRMKKGMRMFTLKPERNDKMRGRRCATRGYTIYDTKRSCMPHLENFASLCSTRDCVAKAARSGGSEKKKHPVQDERKEK